MASGRERFSLLVAALLCLLAMPGARAEDLALHLGYSDKESAIFLVGDGAAIPEKPGIAVEMVEAAAKACGVEVSFARYPGGRLLALAGENTIDGVVMLSFNRERLSLAAYPMTGDAADPDFQIASLSYAFYVRSDSPIAWNGMEITGLSKPIGANLGWSIVDDLRKEGLAVEPAKDTANNFNKLLGGRVDAVAMHTTIGDTYLTHHGIGAKVKRLDPPISTKPYYLALGRAWHDKHPGVAQCLWQSIAEQRRQDMPALLERYRDAIN
ncbi:MAG: transporter substrate-binding domain-containing protein [Proteobacteria bacterium]|nr:transporter substrate-binding domain-containing protein [Pseudomonadota bacterium]